MPRAVVANAVSDVPTIPAAISVASMHPNKTVQQIASTEAYWPDLDFIEKTKLLKKTGWTVVSIQGIAAEPIKVGEIVPSGAWARVNTFATTYHDAIRDTLDKVLMAIQPVKLQTPSIKSFVSHESIEQVILSLMHDLS